MHFFRIDRLRFYSHESSLKLDYSGGIARFYDLLKELPSARALMPKAHDDPTPLIIAQCQIEEH